MKKHVFALVALAIAGSAFAQSTITGATGVVTVTDPTGKVLQSVKVGETVPAGSTLTTSGTVTVQVSGGSSACTATLTSGQSLQLTPSACNAFAQQQALASSAAGGGASTLPPFALVAAVVGGVAVLDVVTKNNNNPISNN